MNRRRATHITHEIFDYGYGHHRAIHGLAKRVTKFECSPCVGLGVILKSAPWAVPLFEQRVGENVSL